MKNPLIGSEVVTGEWLSEKRQRHKLTQADLAGMLGYHQKVKDEISPNRTVISRWETETSEINPRQQALLYLFFKLIEVHDDNTGRQF